MSPVFDFEERSRHKAEGELLCAAWKKGDGDVKHWTAGKPQEEIQEILERAMKVPRERSLERGL